MIRFSVLFLLVFPLIIQGQTNSISVKALPEVINTTQNEELGRWNVDGRSMIFTRLTSQRKYLCIARFDSLRALISVEEFPFDSTYVGGGHTLSPDGKNLVFTLCNRPDGFGGCDLYRSDLKNGKWSTPTNMGPGFNSSSWESQPVFGLDGLSIYFASSRLGGYGGSDIWMAREISPNVWSKSMNVGSGINTSDHEGSPFIHFDGQSMYFMRDGKAGLGGFDLYISHLGANGQWETAENLGSPINSADNDGGFALHPDGKTALITRATTSRQNDLFEFELPSPFQSSPVQVVYVKVLDQENGKPVKAQLEIFDVNENNSLRTSQWSDDHGNIIVTLERNKSYGLIASANNYIIHSSNLPADDSEVRNLSIKMLPMASSADKTIGLQNIFFETGSHALLPSSTNELNILVRVMKNTPGMKIEIMGHTDNVGEEEFNQKLSKSRAKAVYDYLLDSGIESSRLTYKGYGESKPVADNATEEGKRMNRRTEFKIISN